MKQYLFPILLFATIFVSCSPKQEKAATDSKPTSGTAAPTGTIAGTDTIVGPKGSAVSKTITSGEVNTFTYSNYTVKITESADIGGSKISVINGNKEAWEVPFIEMGFFHGISGDCLLVDEGSSDVMRKVHIYDLKTKKEIAVVQSDSDESIEGGYLTFYTLVEEKKIKKLPSCPEAADWKKSGLGIGYVQKRTIELSTGKITDTGEYKCRAMS